MRKPPQEILDLFETDVERGRFETVKWLLEEAVRQPFEKDETVLVPDGITGELREYRATGCVDRALAESPMIDRSGLTELATRVADSRKKRDMN